MLAAFFRRAYANLTKRNRKLGTLTSAQVALAVAALCVVPILIIKGVLWLLGV